MAAGYDPPGGFRSAAGGGNDLAEVWQGHPGRCPDGAAPAGQPITARDLAVTEAAESDLFSLGFTDFRVRMVGRSAKIQLPAAQMPGLLEHRQEILQRLGPDYDGVWLDLEGRE